MIWGIYIVLVLILYFTDMFTAGINPWQNCDYDPGPWCEQEKTKNLVREFSNAFSDISFLAISFYMIICAKFDHENRNKK